MKRTKFQPGAQIAWIPNHAAGDIQHPDVELGFVTSTDGDLHYCRFWMKGQPGVLRTVANSERTPARSLVAHDSVEQTTVDRYMVALGYEVIT